MKQHGRVIAALVRKDFFGLLPLILLAWAVFLLTPIIAGLDLDSLGGDTELWVTVQRNVYWLGFFIGTFLMISALQLDPADSLNHDWLSRPISRFDWLIAKLAFMVLTIVLPVLVARVLVNLSDGLGLAFAVSYAAGVQELEAVMFVPLLLAAALLAPTLRRLIGLLVSVFVLFLLPAWSATSPLLAAVGIRLGNDFDNLMWLQAFVMSLAGIVGAALIYWLLYLRRQLQRARIAFWLMVAAMFLAIYPPESLYDWERAIAVHRFMVGNDTRVRDDDIELLGTTACYPATLVDAAQGVEANDGLLMQAGWLEQQLRDAGPGALTFATPIHYREKKVEWIAPAASGRDVSIEWRVDRIRVQARLQADSLSEPVELQRSFTAAGRYGPIAATETDYWLLPAAATEAAGADPTARLTLEYDLALLSPTPHELPVDGRRHHLPELGACKAERDAANNVIEIDCLQRGPRPALVAAQLIGIDRSRVDSSNRTSYTPWWIEAFSRKQVELTLASPGLVNASSVILTGYTVAQLASRQVITEGVLGDEQSICPLPTEAGFADIEQSSWRDSSPHEVSSVAVERGVRVEVLDWRNGLNPAAPTLLLIPGLGATAHSYDELAAKLASRYNVVGMTRRGTGDSSKPDHGYDIARLSEDVVRVMDSLAIDSAILVGHSFGGEELSYLGANYPARVNGLIYLDAAYDRSGLYEGEGYRLNRELSYSLPEAPPVRPAETVSYVAMQDYARRTGRPRTIPEGEMIASYDLVTGAIRHDSLYLDAMVQGVVTPDYPRIRAPALALYAVPGSAEALMEAWYDRDDPAVQQTVAQLFAMDRQRKQLEIDRFAAEMPNGEVLVLEDAEHWIFLSHEAEVLSAIERFVEQRGRRD
ncbi:MAG: hypothetical protein RLZZ385_842 [Pseudomonadota bacterium]|jgi:pimeloyl-ACP methyl ester carboxylesterase